MSTKQRSFSKPAVPLVLSAVVIMLIIVACSSLSGPSPVVTAPTPEVNQPTQHSTPTPIANTRVASLATPAPPDKWLVALQKTPYPYTTPLPPPTQTSLDGIYVKDEPKVGTPVPCRRCPDYLPEGGIWKLNLDRGIYRIFHEATGWFSLGSFIVSDDQFKIFNDPTCFDTVGLYEWTFETGELSLKPIEDLCQVDRRVRSFANLAWTSCQPPNTEAAVTAHWPQPDGCDSGD